MPPGCYGSKSIFQCYSHDELDFGSFPLMKENTLRETDKQKIKMIRPPRKASCTSSRFNTSQIIIFNALKACFKSTPKMVYIGQ